MLSIHKILHPTDFSALSEAAFHVACALARDYQATLVVAHVCVPPTMYGEGMLVPSWEELQEQMRDRLSRLRAPDDRVNLVHRIEKGEPVEEILRLAASLPADLIVMGTHGRRGLRRLLMGSVAEDVVRKAFCPVLTVRAPIPELEMTLEATAHPDAVEA
jgi:nucleotide-binding universal stress UspA family protein